MKKVLIITYYWPPMGGGGVQRWLKFSKYLRDFGWEPVIYTPLNADVSNPDERLLNEVPEGIEVIRRPIWEPFDLYKKATGKSAEEKIQPGFLQEKETRPIIQKLSVWIRGNVFIPDAKKFWIKPSVKFLSDYLKNNPVDAIVSTGPPHSNHLIALGLKKRLGIKWLADFRDPWTNIDYYDKLMLSKRADAKHHRLERKVLNSADEVVTVSWSWAEDFKKISGRIPKVVTNGYDAADFVSNEKVETSKSKLTITHIGSLNKDRNPYIFWEALGKLKLAGIIDENSLSIQLIGPTDVSVFQEIKKYGIEKFVEHIQHIPHDEVVKSIMKSDALLLPLNDTPNIAGVIPGKLYEYLASRRPIIAIGKPSGDSARIIQECIAGTIIDFNDGKGMKKLLEHTFNEFKQNGLLKQNQVAPEKYSRKSLAGEIAGILSSISQL